MEESQLPPPIEQKYNKTIIYLFHVLIIFFSILSIYRFEEFYEKIYYERNLLLTCNFLVPRVALFFAFWNLMGLVFNRKSDCSRIDHMHNKFPVSYRHRVFVFLFLLHGVISYAVLVNQLISNYFNILHPSYFDNSIYNFIYFFGGITFLIFLGSLFLQSGSIYDSSKYSDPTKMVFQTRGEKLLLVILILGIIVSWFIIGFQSIVSIILIVLIIMFVFIILSFFD